MDMKRPMPVKARDLFHSICGRRGIGGALGECEVAPHNVTSAYRNLLEPQIRSHMSAD